MPAMEESTEELLETARAAGYDVTAYQVRRWHRAGLLEPPRQQALGRGRGTVSLYRAGTRERLLAICRLHHAHRSLRELRWLLWWERCDVPAEWARQSLLAEARAVREQLDALVTDGALTEEAEQVLEAASTARLPTKSMRWARKRVGAKDFGWFVESLFLAGAGRGKDLLNEDIEVLERGLGLDRARSDRLPSGQPWLTGDPRADLVTMAKLFHPGELVAGLDELDDAELVAAREEAKAFLVFVATVGRVVRTGFDRWAYGFGMFGTWVEDVARDPASQRRLLLVWLAFRRTELRDNMRAAISQAKEVAEAERALQMVEALREAVPALGKAITVREVVRASFDPSARAHLQQRIACLRDSHAAEIDSFLAVWSASALPPGVAQGGGTAPTDKETGTVASDDTWRGPPPVPPGPTILSTTPNKPGARRRRTSDQA